MVIRSGFILGWQGRSDARSAFQFHTLCGLVLSVALHFALLGAYFLFEYLGRDDAPMVQVRIMRYSELGPPPSLTSEATHSVGITPTTRPSIGIPVPVPDVEVSPEQTFATQRELSQTQTPATAEAGEGGIVVEQDISIDDPGIDAFVPVEKLPMPIRQIKPVFPEIARRSGVEGTVWVKILVDKEGNARKAVVVRSEVGIFDDAAVEAALQWKFTPAIMNNGPVSVWVAIPFRFRLTDKPS
jgi:protein TonB